MLSSAGLLSAQEYQQIAAALDQLLTTGTSGKFAVTSEVEDGHTAIELPPTEALGTTGKKSTPVEAETTRR